MTGIEDVQPLIDQFELHVSDLFFYQNLQRAQPGNFQLKIQESKENALQVEAQLQAAGLSNERIEEIRSKTIVETAKAIASIE